VGTFHTLKGKKRLERKGGGEIEGEGGGAGVGGKGDCRHSYNILPLTRCVFTASTNSCYVHVSIT
jgi:hypothetical protein